MAVVDGVGRSGSEGMRGVGGPGAVRPGSAARSAGILLLGALAAVGCMEQSDLLAPEMPEDVGSLEIYTPGRGDDWQSKEPAEVGFDADKLQEAVAYALANEADTPTDLRAYLESRFAGQPHQKILGPIRERGPMAGMIVYRGFILAEWGDTERVDMAFSVTKSFLATLVGLAWDRGLIADLHDRVGELVHDGGYDSPHNAPITWHQSLQQTSEWEGVLFDKPDTADRREGVDRVLRQPGTFWEYNDVRVNRLALSALRVWGEPLPDVLEREIMTPIGATRSWRWHGYRNSTVEVDGKQVQSVSGGGHWGGGLWISTRDLARFGLLYLRRGRWRDRQILSEKWIRAATTPSELNPNYGYMWWLNSDGGLWPSAPHEAYAARGGGDNLLWIDPVHDLVVVVRWIQRGTEDGLLARVLAAAPPAPETGAEGPRR